LLVGLSADLILMAQNWPDWCRILFSGGKPGPEDGEGEKIPSRQAQRFISFYRTWIEISLGPGSLEKAKIGSVGSAQGQ
jgi:hypothetical protein